MLATYSFEQIFQALEKLYIVTIPVDQKDSPQKIFESINSTGAKLSSADLIRNFILMDIPSEQQDALYNNYWKSIESNVGYQSKHLETFFRAFIACKTYDMPTSSNIYSSFKIWYISEISVNKSTITDILEDINNYAKIYNLIKYKETKEIDKKIRESIIEFRKIPSDLPVVFYLAIIKLYQQNTDELQYLSSDQINTTFTLFSTYLVRRFICDLDTSDNKLFTLFLKDIMKECKSNYSKYIEILNNVVVNKQKDKLTRMPNDEEFIRHLKEDNLYTKKLWLKVIFDRIESYKNNAPVLTDKLSIEHLMPQTPTAEWLNELNIDKETYTKNLNKFGNLTLVGKVDNSIMGNKPFQYKKSILETTQHLKLNIDVYNLPSWNINEIHKRTETLIKKTLKIFPYVSSNDDDVNKMYICIEKENLNAKAIIFISDGSVQILADSQLSKMQQTEGDPDEVEDLYFQLLEDGIIKENDNNAVFLKDYLIVKRKYFDSLNLAELLILGGKQTAEPMWSKINGEKIIKDLKNERYE